MCKQYKRIYTAAPGKMSYNTGKHKSQAFFPYNLYLSLGLLCHVDIFFNEEVGSIRKVL
jgi:hypothetical protein